MAGLGVAVIEGRTGLRRVEWQGGLYQDAGLTAEALTAIMDNTALGAASEGIVAAAYGETQWDSTGSGFPIVVEDGSVAIQCSTDLAQRMEGVNGFGTTIACQINLAAVSGLAQWDSYLKPASDEGDDIAVDTEAVTQWMDALANNYSNGDVRLDDRAVFDIDPDTGKSRADISGIDGRPFTLGKTMPEIVEDVLDKSVEDIRGWLLENPHVMGTILQSALNPVDKARFVDFGINSRPRMTAWPATLNYEDQPVNLLPEAPGPFARVQLPVDVSPADSNAAPEMVFPWYRVSITVDTSAMQGSGELMFALDYRCDTGEVLESLGTRTYDIATASLGDGDIPAAMDTSGEYATVILILDNSEAGRYFYSHGSDRAALTLSTELQVVDEAQPPYNLILDITLQPLCDMPADIAAEPAAYPEAGSCPVEEPPAADGDGDEETAETPQTSDAEDGCALAGDSMLMLLMLMSLFSGLRRRR